MIKLKTTAMAAAALALFAAPVTQAQEADEAQPEMTKSEAVSYTHLTLPTILRV